MTKIKELFIKLDNWLTKTGYSMYPGLTKHMNKKNE